MKVDQSTAITSAELAVLPASSTIVVSSSTNHDTKMAKVMLFAADMIPPMWEISFWTY